MIAPYTIIMYWKGHLPGLYAKLEAAGTLEETAHARAVAANDEIQRLVATGLYENEATEIVLADVCP